MAAWNGSLKRQFANGGLWQPGGEEDMKKQEELYHEIEELMKATKEKKIRWNVEVQTTEGNDPGDKPVETEDGVTWTVDECYVSYNCQYKGKEFCMITYEMIKTAGERISTSNMVFLPPLGVRVFDLRTLLPHSVEASRILLDRIHQLWVLLFDLHREDRSSVRMEIRTEVLKIED